MHSVEINIIRHAQSMRQVLGDGDWDSSLSNTGQKQAECMARWLSTSDFILFGLRTSPLNRAKETTNIIASMLQLPVTVDLLLAEADFHVSDELPSFKAPFESLSSHVASDRYAQLKLQAKEALQRLFEVAESGNGRVLSVSHGGLIKLCCD